MIEHISSKLWDYRQFCDFAFEKLKLSLEYIPKQYQTEDMCIKVLLWCRKM